jgi:Cu2+-containing amine oxidase
MDADVTANLLRFRYRAIPKREGLPGYRRIAVAALAGLAIASSEVFAHPLDGLSAKEIAAVVEIAQADGKVTGDARYPLIELKEPDKSAVLAW